jgi:hypothetical protein
MSCRKYYVFLDYIIIWLGPFLLKQESGMFFGRIIQCMSSFLVDQVIPGKFEIEAIRKPVQANNVDATESLS